MNIKTRQNRLATEADQATVEQQGGRVLKLGLDVHYRQATVAMQEDGGRIRVAGKMSHEAFAGWIRKKAAEGWAIFSCYEAGASGYWLHREAWRQKILSTDQEQARLRKRVEALGESIWRPKGIGPYSASNHKIPASAR